VPGEPASSSRLIGGRYRLVTAIGQGSMGRVWQARDELLGRDVALKEILFPPEFGEAGKDELQQRLLREARSAARLSHPAVATVFDVVGDRGRPWIVMELVRGRSLDRILQEDGPLPPGIVAEMGRHLLAALAAAHAVGVLHRDVKPSNVLLTGDGGAVLTDFGVATIDGDPSLTQGGMIMGTPAYSAPERIRGQAATSAADLWSLGLTLYAALEGQGPYDDCGSIASTIAAIVTEDLAPPGNAGPVTPAIMALLSRDPAARPTAEVAMRMLAEAATSPSAPQAETPSGPPHQAETPSGPSAAQPGLPAGDPGRPEAPGRKPRRTRRAVTAMACLVVALGISLWALRQSAHQTAAHQTAARQTSQSLPDIQSPPPTTEKPAKTLGHKPKARKQPPVTQDTPAQPPVSQQPVPTAPTPSASAHATDAAGKPAPSPSQQPSSGCGTLLAGQVLNAGESLTSCNGEYLLGMQGDGNLVLYSKSGPVWNSSTSTADEAVMQPDGNFVLYTSSGSAVWDSGTSGSGAYLVVRNSGDVVIYAASGTKLWDSATNGT
jgi:serine/threonine protein kinase